MQKIIKMIRIKSIRMVKWQKQFKHAYCRIFKSQNQIETFVTGLDKQGTVFFILNCLIIKLYDKKLDK
jgi:hypothetical protein